MIVGAYKRRGVMHLTLFSYTAKLAGRISSTLSLLHLLQPHHGVLQGSF